MWHWQKNFQIMKAIHDISGSRAELSQACINGVLVVTVHRYHTGVSWLQGGAPKAMGEIIHVATKGGIGGISPENMEELLVSSGEPLTNEKLDHNMPFKET
jgi:hypothetical protein